MAKDKRKTYYIQWEYELWSKNPDGSIYYPAVVKERTFLWMKRIVAGGFDSFREAGDYVYDVLKGKLTKKQSKAIYGRVR